MLVAVGDLAHGKGKTEENIGQTGEWGKKQLLYKKEQRKNNSQSLLH